MNVFEDLVEELKEENLLESTFIEGSGTSHVSANGNELPLTPPFGNRFGEADVAEEPLDSIDLEEIDVEMTDGSDIDDEIDVPEEPPVTDVPQITKAKSQTDFLRRRANEEVSSLQMVEHVLAGVEREHLKMVPTPYDDLNAKKALHRFLQSLEVPRSEETADAEYELLQETQTWASELAERDSRVSVANLRRFCENSRPALSSQALIALARFYRNGALTDVNLEKFDFVMTRLFSRDAGGEKRRFLFERPEVVPHIKTLYGNWSSVCLYSVEENGAEIKDLISSLAALRTTADAADTIDQLLASGVFESVRSLKQQAGEYFMVPEVLAAAIDTNIHLGNRFVELAEESRKVNSLDEMEERFGDQYDHLISTATGKTYLLCDLVSGDATHGRERINVNFTPAASVERTETTSTSSAVSSSFLALRINKWLLLAATILIGVSIGLYLWADQMVESNKASIVADEIDLAGTELAPHLGKAKLTKDTFYGMTEPTWDSLTESEQKQITVRAYQFAQQKNLSKVSILNYRGRTVAFATANTVEVVKP
ncbi:MAG: hypothetical protein IPM21_16185 [Acidobacteria bacterium]|nr:hypothetical protein [Acidobacteriota bacterium]